MTMASGVSVDQASGQITIQELTIQDPELANYLSEFDDAAQADAVKRALRVGATTLELSETSKDVEFVRREFTAMERAVSEIIQEIEEDIESTFGDDGEVAELLEQHFGEDGEFARRLDAELGENGERFQSALDPDVDGTPTNRLKEFLRNDVREELRNEIRSIHEKLDREDAQAAVRQRTPLKGADFEDDLETLLEDLVHGSTDTVEYTGGNEGELSGRNVGDFVITLGDTNQRIVVEAKSEQGYSQPRIKSEMEEAIENRDADYGLFITECATYVPNKVGYLQEFDGQILSIALCEDEDDEIDPRLLKIGFNWARMRTVQAYIDSGDTVDAEVIQSKVSEVRDSVDQFKNIRRKCTSIRSTVQGIENDLDDIEADINSDLNQMTAELSKSVSEQ
ncbi:hypothetical protein [Halosegnis marinus]|uniref:Restriction endonuclease type IV Mrr domain-containing protein n=1 Tax=Halosegnis marinus TaxID=3034023 RepID=A0ABD5ZTT4_9EURY|nr:hypothetical protein [Halosegnis sp. DT85]